MTKNKRKGRPTLQEALERPWCYYCDREFDDMKVLINHQKAKHLKCQMCPRRLDTAGGLGVHMQQVHKETLTRVENALEGREDPNVEIFGMEGIPMHILEARHATIRAGYNDAGQSETGGNNAPAAKKIKIETPEELKKRLAEHRAKKAAAAAGLASGTASPAPKPESPKNAQVESQFQPPSATSPANVFNPFTQPPASSPPPAMFGQPFGQPPPQSHVNPYGGHPPFPQQQFSPHPGYGMPGPPMPQNGPGHPGFGSPPPAPYMPHHSPQQFGGPFNQQRPPHWQGPPGPGFPNVPPSNGFPHGGFPPNGAGGFSPSGPPLSGSPFPPYGGHHPPPQSPQTLPSRQNSLPGASSLPIAPGLPPRPNFDAPAVSRSDMHNLHSGKITGIGASQPAHGNRDPKSGPDEIDRLIAEGEATAARRDAETAERAVRAKHQADEPNTTKWTNQIDAKEANSAPSDAQQVRQSADNVVHNGQPLEKSNGGSVANEPSANVPTTDGPQKEASKSVAPKEKVKKPVVLFVRDKDTSPEEKMALMSRYSFTTRKSSAVVGRA